MIADRPSTWNTTERLRYFVTLRLDQHTYALPVESIAQIIEMVTITPLPQVNYVLAGVIIVRGATVPVIDLRGVLGLASARRELHTPIVLVQIDGREVGLIVDAVLDVRAVEREQVVCPQNILPEGLGAAPLIEGLIRDQAGTVLLLDLAQLFQPLPGGGLAVQALAAVPLPDGDGADRPEVNVPVGSAP